MKKVNPETADPFAPVHEPTDPELEQMLSMMRMAAAALPPITSFTPQQLRAQAEQTTPAPVRRDDAVERSVPGPAGAIPIRILGTHSSPRAVYVRFHGGGWIGGAYDHQDEMLHAFGERLGAAIVSVDYRLAPEARFPEPIDDCEAAALWVIENALSEFGTDAVLIGGDSAGAYLTAATILRLRDRHGYTGFRGADLRYGMYDLRLTPSVRHYKERGLNEENLRWLLDHVVDAELREELSPLLADLGGLPPAIFTCGTEDSLLDDTLFMWARWRAAGNDAELALYPGAPHAFDLAPLKVGAQAIDRVVEFLDGRLAALATTPA
ncbi:MAG TPA: alpha/beta hydrolase [Candidatus Dormibacteraeota bacterium]